jgi:hypothetical protein
MATARAVANVAVQNLFAVPLHMKGKIDTVTVDNEGSSGAIKVQLEDDFTQDVSQGNNTPTARSAFPYQATVAQGLTDVSDVLSVEKIECLGNVGVICDKSDAGCAVIVEYHFE